MGKAARRKPKLLADKLRHIRKAVGLSQNGVIRRLGLSDVLFQDSISAFERGVREPDLPTLLAYARLAGVYVDVLIDDELDLPETIPSPAKYRAGIKRR